MPVRGRTCVGCRRVRRRNELIRVVRGADGSVRLDAAGSAPGRGAYVCRDRECLRRARGKLAGALRAGRVDFAEIERDLVVVVA